MRLLDPSDMPTRSVTTQLRRTVSRTISCEFDVTDNIVRSYPDNQGRGNFNPKHVTVRINLDTCTYVVTLTGPMHGEAGGPNGNLIVNGTEHYLDADVDNPGLVADAVVDCLVEHEKVNL